VHGLLWIVLDLRAEAVDEVVDGAIGPEVVVSTLQIVDSSTDLSRGTLFSKLRTDAARRGCDAVIVVGRSDRTPIFEGERQEGYLASCIQYLDVVVTSTPAPVPTTGSICFTPGRGHAVIEVDRRDYRVN